jgi:hypothetical protein
MPLMGSRRLVSLAAAVSLAGCASIDVRFDYDPEANFDALKTYAWMERPDPQKSGADPRVYNALLDSRVRAAVDRELGAKGYRNDAQDPDFLVIYHAAIDRKVEADAINYYHGYGAAGWYGPGRTDVYIREYEEGTLLLDVVRPGGKELMWRGAASSRIDDRASPEERTERVNEAVRQLIEGFPPVPD